MARHLVGVPRARDLVVNGVPTKPGSPHAAVRRIYKSAIRPLAETSAPAPVRLATARTGDPRSEIGCAWCGGPMRTGETIVLDTVSDRWWHMVSEAGNCRKRWLDHQHEVE